MSELASTPPPEPAPVFAVVEDAEQGRFELQRDGETVSYASYQQSDDVVTIPRVATIPEHRGQGYAARLLDGAFDQLRSSQRSVVPLCPFAAQHIRDSPEHHDLLTK